MMKIVATPAMQDALEEALKTGRITMTAVDYARARGYSDATIMRILDSNRDRRAQTAAQSSTYRSMGAEPNAPAAPTAEWMARNLGHFTKQTRWLAQDVLVPSPFYRLITPLERASEKIDPRATNSIEWMANAGISHQRIRISNWQREGGRSSLARLGGIGERHDPKRDQEERDRATLYEMIFRSLFPEQRRLFAMIVNGPELHPDGSLYSLEEIAADLNPHFGDQRMRRGYTIGCIEHLGLAIDWYRRNLRQRQAVKQAIGDI